MIIALRGWFSEPANILAFAQLVAAAVTALATIALWRVTCVLATETTALAKMTSRAFVISSFESSGVEPTALNLVLRNTGNATAFDVKLRMTPALPNPSGEQVIDLEATTFEASLLPPGQALTIKGVMSWHVHETVFHVMTSWAQTPNGEDREELSYKTEPKDGFQGGWKAKGLHDVAEEIKGLRSGLAK